MTNLLKELLSAALNEPNINLLYYSSRRDDCVFAFKEMQNLLNEGIEYKAKISNLTITLFNESKINFRCNADQIRGMSINAVVIDEIIDQDKIKLLCNLLPIIKKK